MTIPKSFLLTEKQCILPQEENFPNPESGIPTQSLMKISLCHN